MFILRQAQRHDAPMLSGLIYAAAPDLLSYLFGNENDAATYLENALQQPDGQYCALRHQVLVKQDPLTQKEQVVGCITLWHDQLGDEFIKQTLMSIATACQSEQIAHISQVNTRLQIVFPAPNKHELALGHISVLPEYQGLGLGKKLIAYGIRQAKLLGKKHIVLDVDSNNEQAVSFYTGCEFMQSNETHLAEINRCFLRMLYRVN